jgi:quinol monooxygenase YgiN
MNIAQLLLMGAAVLTASISGPAVAADVQRLYVQEAEIEIDPIQLEAYKSALTEHIETATRVEPGVFALYAVSEKDKPARIRVFEIYRDLEAYRSHLETAHFKKYKAAVEQMVRSLKLIQATPIAFATKP